jgi:hypothetical protein
VLRACWRGQIEPHRVAVVDEYGGMCGRVAAQFQQPAMIRINAG